MPERTTESPESIGAPAEIAAGSTVGPVAHIGEGVVVEPGCTIGARATVAAAVDGEPGPRVARGARIGVGAVVIGAITIGEEAIVRPGAVVTRDVPARATVAGSPARIIGDVGCDPDGELPTVDAPDRTGATVPIGRCSLLRLPHVIDHRGTLAFAQIGAGLPFEPRRFFVNYDVPTESLRGSHAHRTLHELLVVVGGSVTVVVDDGDTRARVFLDDPTKALHLPPMVWSIQYAYDATAALVVLCSDEYDDADYIRDYEEYLELVRVANRR